MKALTALACMTVLMLGTDMTQAAEYTRQKVVYHVNSGDPNLLSTALGNIQNHIYAVGQDNIEIKVVLHGDGIDLLKIANNDIGLRNRIIDLKSQKVGFDICKNTLAGRRINYKTDLYDVSESDIVPSGVAEIAKLQQEGYAYIKP